ncbi:MAG: 1-deoxy-D-xylulose-5-phosphate synthase N-terminal domain-containing protein [Acidobacteriota bacterium]|nr:1-deoxy-D-xylulose-5-phosphate synthase N-terminal domain-containing protein [Acidobacteriota bacterium]
MDLATLAAEATELRREILQALYDCGGGHYGGTLSVLDLLLTLYRCQLRIFPDHPEDPHRDRLILSKGHAALALYAVQRRLGFYHHPLAGYGTATSPLEGHPDVAELPEVEFSTGSLGQGLSVGVGMALALREQQPEAAPRSLPQVWVVLGDGECQEGQVWEAAMLAARLGLTNLTAVIDANGYQEYGWAPQGDPCPVPDLPAKLRAFGWRVTEVDGHDHGNLAQVFDQIITSSEEPGARSPAAVVARTVKGKGVPLAEADPLRFHCTTVTQEEHHRMLAGLS